MRVHFERDEKTMKEEFRLAIVNRYMWAAPIQSLMAFNEGLIAVLDNTNKLSVVQLPPPFADDRPCPADSHQTLTAIHAEDVSGWSLAFHTHTALTGSREAKSYHAALGVIRNRSKTLFLCGTKSVWRIQVDRWNQRIEEQISRSRLAAALDIFLCLHSGTLPTLLDYPHKTDLRQRAVTLKASQFIQTNLVSQLEQLSSRGERLSVRQMCFVAVRACVDMQLWSVLYTTVFECFKAVDHMNVYCSTLEPFIVQRRIPRENMDSEVLASILKSYTLPLEAEEQQALQQFKEAASPPAFLDCDHYPEMFPVARRLSRLVLYVDVSQIDLDLSIKLLTRYRLWTALVHLHSALRQYTVPLELLVGECTQLAKRCIPEQDEGAAAALQVEAPLRQCRLVRKLFFVLHRCFELRSFPLDAKEGPGMVPPTAEAIADLLRLIFRRDGNAMALFTQAPAMFLRLLRLSPAGLFRALSVLYTSPLSSRAVESQGRSESPESAVLGEAFYPLTLMSLFLAIEAAVEACKMQAAEDGGVALQADVDEEFLWFVARAVSRASLTIPGDRFSEVVDHVFSAFADAEEVPGRFWVARPSKDEAQQLLIGVIAAQEDNLDNAQREDIIARATQQGFYSLASWLYEERLEYGRALDSRLHDETLRDGIFEYIISRLVERCAEGTAEATALVEATLQRLPRLVEIDRERSAAMICEQLSTVADHDSVLRTLQGHQDIELQYLETLMMNRRKSHWRHGEDQSTFVEKHTVRYIELLCILQPHRVLPFLTENETIPLRECLDLVQRHQVTDSAMYLLERTGDFPAVLELLLSDYDEAIEALHRAFLEDSSAGRAVKQLVPRTSAEAGAAPAAELAAGFEPSTSPWWSGFAEGQRCVELLEGADRLSARKKDLMTEPQLEELWFGLMHRTVRHQERALPNQEASRRHAAVSVALQELSSRGMAGVLAYLALPRSVQRICDDFGETTLGIWKAPLKRMLDGLSFQRGVLQAAGAVAAQDVNKPFATVKAKGSRGVRVKLGSRPPEFPLRISMASPGAVTTVSSVGRR